MKITKEFLDKAFSHESIKKYAFFDYELAEYKLSQKWIDWSYKHLVNLEHEEALNILGRKSAQVANEAKRSDNFNDRNDFAQVWRCIVNNIDYDFKVGEIVTYPITRSYTKGRILKIKDSMVFLENLKRGSKFWIDLSSVRKTDEQEQMSLDI